MKKEEKPKCYNYFKIKTMKKNVTYW